MPWDVMCHDLERKPGVRRMVNGADFFSKYRGYEVLWIKEDREKELNRREEITATELTCIDSIPVPKHLVHISLVMSWK